MQKKVSLILRKGMAIVYRHAFFNSKTIFKPNYESNIRDSALNFDLNLFAAAVLETTPVLVSNFVL